MLNASKGTSPVDLLLSSVFILLAISFTAQTMTRQQILARQLVIREGALTSSQELKRQIEFEFDSQPLPSHFVRSARSPVSQESRSFDCQAGNSSEELRSYATCRPLAETSSPATIVWQMR